MCFLSQLPSEGCVGLPLGKGWEQSRCPAELGAQSAFPLQQQAGPAPEPGGSVLTPPLWPYREESGLSLCSSPSDAQELCELKQPKGKEAAVCYLQGNYLVPVLLPLTSATWCRCWMRPQACAVAQSHDQARVPSWRGGPFLATLPLPRQPHLHDPWAPGPWVQAPEAEASLAFPTAVLWCPTPQGGSGIRLSEPRATSPPSPWARPELGVVTLCVPLVPETEHPFPPSESHCCKWFIGIGNRWPLGI